MCAVPSHGIPVGMIFPWTSLLIPKLVKAR